MLNKPVPTSSACVHSSVPDTIAIKKIRVFILVYSCSSTHKQPVNLILCSNSNFHCTVFPKHVKCRRNNTWVHDWHEGTRKACGCVIIRAFPLAHARKSACPRDSYRAAHILAYRAARRRLNRLVLYPCIPAH